ncbi:MJ0042-type zinc finger domain-containing protein [Rhodoplanes sp. SY1]|uniref:MJ0042-type zinc finger domain-containing protein n=1 Tax=Rhodoplanes sp. SY1 TaxID=3166646 RepID=UPI0038B67E06
MKIVCPRCEAWYEVPEASVGRGRAVRCAECRTEWTATAEDAVRAEEAAFRREAARRETERAAAAAASAFATASAGEPGWGGGTAPTGFDAPPASAASAEPEDDGWPDDLMPPKPAAAAEPEPDGFSAAAVEDAPSVVPETDPFTLPEGPTRDWDAEFEAAEARRIARERAKPQGKRRFAIPKPTWATVSLALLVVIGAILGWRADVVRALPQTGGLFAAIGLPVNLRGLAFDAVKVQADVSDKVPVVIVEGVVVNVSKVRIDVPRLRFAMRDQHGAETHTWTALPQKPSLAPGESQPFRTRLASPPADSREVFVRFFNRRDL